MKKQEIPFMTKVPYVGKANSRENIFLIRKCLKNLEDFTYLSRSAKDVFSNWTNTVVPKDIKISIDVEKGKIKEWLNKYDEGYADQMVMQQREDELRLHMVKQFIYK